MHEPHCHVLHPSPPSLADESHRRPRRGWLAVLMAAVLLGYTGTVLAADTASARPDFSGHWVLNEKQSDMPRPGGMGGGGMRGGPGGGGMRGGPGGGGMRGGGMGGPPGGGTPGEGAPGGGERRGSGGFMNLPNDMVAELADTDLTLSVRGLAVRRLRFPGALAGTPPTDTIPSTPAVWAGERIVSKFESRRGAEIVERWEVSKDGKQLIVKTALPAMGERPGIELKRVYDRAEAE